MMTSFTGRLTAIDQRLKSLDAHTYSRWLLLPSGIVIAILVPWLFGSVGSPLRHYAWPLSAPFAVFSFIGIGTVWRTRHTRFVKVGFLLVHFAAAFLFVAPILFFVWFSSVMSDH